MQWIEFDLIKESEWITQKLIKWKRKIVAEIAGLINQTAAIGDWNEWLKLN